MKLSVEIRKMTHDDVEILSSIQKQAFLPLYERYHDAGNPFLRGPEDILTRLDNPIFQPFTILCDGAIVGGLWYRSQGKGLFFQNLEPGEYYLQRMFILPEKQGRKIAQKAIKLAEESLEGANASMWIFPLIWKRTVVATRLPVTRIREQGLRSNRV
ncbi:MAG: GNAT family N-acetyltransferase [Clostridiales bacterium]|nr:GNAT family N-acetyltransferase [Clostridiales bacterium]